MEKVTSIESSGFIQKLVQIGSELSARFWVVVENLLSGFGLLNNGIHWGESIRGAMLKEFSTGYQLAMDVFHALPVNPLPTAESFKIISIM